MSKDINDLIDLRHEHEKLQTSHDALRAEYEILYNEATNHKLQNIELRTERDALQIENNILRAELVELRIELKIYTAS